MSYVIKTGDRLPSIKGTISPPAGLSLDGVTLTMRIRGQKTQTSRDLEVSNDGETSVGSGVWAWHYDWQAGDTDVADDYDLELAGEVDGEPMTFPNKGYAFFRIEARLPAP